MLEGYNFTSELKKIGFAGSYLSGATAEWWITLFQKYEESQAKGIHPPSEFASFAAFSRSLTMSYGDPDLKSTMEHDLYALRQTFSVADYAAEYRCIANYLAPGWSEEPLVFHFRLHLKENIKDALVHEKPYPKTLREMVTAAIRLDNREREKIRDRRITAPPSIYCSAVIHCSAVDPTRIVNKWTCPRVTSRPPFQNSRIPNLIYFSVIVSLAWLPAFLVSPKSTYHRQNQDLVWRTLVTHLRDDRLRCIHKFH
jgi:Retrotransposon gag protein